MSIKEQEILKAATSLFSKYGFHAVGVDSIVAESRVAKMTFYKYFHSKEYLIESVLEKRDMDLRKNITEAIDQRRSPKTKLKAIFTWYSEWFSMNDFQGCLFIKASEEFPQAGIKIREISRSHKVWLENKIRELLKQFNPKYTSELPALILVLLDGLTVRANMFDDDRGSQVNNIWKYVSQLIESER